MCENPIFLWECKGRVVAFTLQIVGKEFSVLWTRDEDAGIITLPV
jgi:hypothetical protein